jgi:hypothetical protein
MAVLSVLAAVITAQIVAVTPTAQAIICVGIGRVIGISDCFGGGYALQNHAPPPSDYAPLPQDYAPTTPPPPPDDSTATTTSPPPAP